MTSKVRILLLLLTVVSCAKAEDNQAKADEKYCVKSDDGETRCHDAAIEEETDGMPESWKEIFAETPDDEENSDESDEPKTWSQKIVQFIINSESFVICAVVLLGLERIRRYRNEEVDNPDVAQ